ncbi:MAG TPA: diacylglycerol kinase family protein [Thermoguttaceae bacterium]|nr:diacylglycerol kinase family protein [Thermoguttaceae bacterium]
MSQPAHLRPERGWSEKFRDAFHGLLCGIRGQSSFFAHLFITAVVLVAGALLHLNHVDWCLLVLCIFGVLAAEMLNSALESMARAITDETDPHVGEALDIGSAAVLLASIGSAVVGLIVLLHGLGELTGYF